MLTEKIKRGGEAMGKKIRRVLDGDTVLHLGDELILRLRAEGEPRAERSGGELIVRANAEDVRTRLIYWYSSETRKIVGELIPLWSKRLAVRPRSAAVKLTTTRWGSCTASGELSMNARIAMLPPKIAEYLVVHELCHLKRMDHSPAFWREVEAALPNALALRRELRAIEPMTML